MNVLMLDQSPIPYTPETPYVEPLGGSETAFVLLARGFAALGLNVVLLNNTNTHWRQGNLAVSHLNALPIVLNKADVVIANRTLLGLDLGKPFFYWAHDAYDQTHILSWMAKPEIWSKVTEVWCVSQWQKETFIRFYRAPAEKLYVLGNPIDLVPLASQGNKVPKSFIYASIPFKGLEMLAPFWQDLRLEVKDDDLQLWVFSSMDLYQRPEENEKYREIYSYLGSLPGVRLSNVVSMVELSDWLRKASFYLHPSIYHETFCMVCVQAMATGCLPIAPSYGALPEVIQDGGFLIPQPNFLWPATYEAMLETTVKLLKTKEEDLWKVRQRARKLAMAWDYIKVARRAYQRLIERR